MMTNQTSIDDFLENIAKPSRYLGTEINSSRKPGADFHFLLAFPDTYEVGMSHLGLQILYSILNQMPDVAAERCFAPWPDLEKQLRDQKVLLTSLENKRALKDFDIVGFSLQYELSYTNVLNMLELGGIPIDRNQRRDGHPLVIAGGPCCFNPAPLTPFIDAFVIGEGEDVIGEIVSHCREGKKKAFHRGDFLTELARLDGLYVPAIHNKNHIIRKRIVPDLNSWEHPLKPIVPLMQTIHDRISLEIARGCTRGCRFCQAGMVWRPYRERKPSLLLEMAEKMLASTGHEELSLLSLSSGDYSCLEPLVKNLMNRYYQKRVALALPSLRVESLNETLMEEIKRIRKTSFTLAPEAGTDKMRLIINKGNSAEDLLSTVDKIFAAGWKSIKLYFMLGLPYETKEDWEGIVNLAYESLRTAKNRGQVTINLSTFVPKPHTPFQWERQISLEETYEAQEFIRRKIKHRNINVKWHDARMSFLEGIFSRGDERLGMLLETAFRKGCRLDGWSDILRFDLWQEAIAENGINPADFLRERDINEILPWDNIDCGVNRTFLLNERRKAIIRQATPDCRFDTCQHCGVCNFETIQNLYANAELSSLSTSESPLQRKVRYRITFSKTGPARFLSHLELAASLVRTFRRSPLHVAYSSGFHPHAQLSFAVATAVGMESYQEYLDVTVWETPADLDALKSEMNLLLPKGVKILDIRKLSHGEKTIAQAVRGFEYELHLPAELTASRLSEIDELIAGFLAASAFHIPKTSKGKTVIQDIRPFVQNLSLDRNSKTIKIVVFFAQEGSARPMDILMHVLKTNPEEMKQIRIIKIKTQLNERE